MSEIQKHPAAELSELAGEINSCHRACEEAIGAALGHAMRAGELLIEAKGEVAYGEWGTWLRENFEGSERTAQAYMKVARGREQLEEAQKRNGVADLSFRGALKELAAPAAEAKNKEPDPEEAAEFIRALFEHYEPRLEDKEDELITRRLEEPEDLEFRLLDDLMVEWFHLLANVVAVEGFFIELDGDERPMLSYRTPDKRHEIREPLPTSNPALRELVHRGCRPHALYGFKVWRLLDQWATKVVAASSDELEVIERRVQRNADWRPAEPAADYLREKLFRDVSRRTWAADHGLDDREFKESVEGLEVWINREVRHMESKLFRGAA